MALYIPFWLYSNLRKKLSSSMLRIFTFHSGYIPINVLSDTIFSYCYFTFHSGYIPIVTGAICSIGKTPLHSILVIFQLQDKHSRHLEAYLYIPFWLYSNRRG